MTSRPGVDPATVAAVTADDVVRRGRALQAEAAQLYDVLALDRLAPWGTPIRVGSAALGLMVRRDLDVTVVCPALDTATATADGVARLGAALYRHPAVSVVNLRDDTGQWNTDPAYPDGLYLGVRCRPASGHDWTLDIWFIDGPNRQPDLQHLRTIPPRLTDETRRTILTIKQACLDTPPPGPPVSGHEVYTSVLDHGARSPEQFHALRATG